MTGIADADDGAGLPLVFLPPHRTLDAAMRESGSSPAFDRVLRAAISLRGGVSLAVWIAGALAELDLVRRIRVARRPDGSLAAFVLAPAAEPPSGTLRVRIAAYARVLAAAGYDEVQFDVIAGASAGGLSAILYAVAQRAGTDFDAILPVWREAAGLQRLLQPPGIRGVEAPLRGDAYFWKTATGAAAELYRRGGDRGRSHRDLVPVRLGVHLAATVINSEAESESDVREGRGHFVFHVDDRRGAPLPHGIPSAWADADPEPPEVALLRLAYAARATSSLPGGFEVARVVSPSETRRETVATSESQAPLAREAVAESLSPDEGADSVFASGSLRPDFAFAFSLHRPPRDVPDDAGPYEVIDGGIFDNVPLDRALRVIRGTVGTMYGDRALLDLDPEPEARHVSTAGAPPRQAVQLWTVLAAWLQRVRRRESADEELEEVHRFNAELSAEQGRLEALAAVVGAVDLRTGTEHDRLRGYLRSVGGTDAVFLTDAISRPSRWQLTSTLPRRRKLRALPAQLLTPLLPALMAAYAQDGDLSEAEGRIERLPSGLIDAAHAVLAWVRAVESREGPEAGAALDALQSIRTRVAEALAIGHRARDAAAYRVLLLTSRHAATEPDEPVDDELVALWVRAWVARGRGEEGRVRQAQEEAALAAHHRRLDEDIRALRALSPPEDAADETGVPWGATVWHAVDERFRGRDLRTFDVIALVAPAGMQPPMSLVATGRIAADERPPATYAFPTVVAEERRRALQDAIDGRPDSADGRRLRHTAKLAGHGLGNLLGLVSADWRMNDWWWGRLDGAAGMVRFLASRSPDPLPGREVEELVTAAQGGLRAEAGPEILRGGADGLANLSAEYRVALATRALGAALRSAVPRRRTTGDGPARLPGGRYAALLLELLLRPLLLLLALAAVPVRLVVGAGAVAGLGWALTRALDPDAARGPWGLDVALALLAALATAAAILVITRGGVRRWKSVSSGSIPRPGGVSAEDSEAARAAARGVSNAAGAVAVIAAASLGWSVAEGRLLASAGWLVVAVLAAVWAVRTRTRVPLLQAPPAPVAAAGAVAAFAVLAVAGPVLDAVVRLPDPGIDWLGLAQLLVFAAVLSVALVLGWENPVRVLVALVAGAALWLAAELALLLVAAAPGTVGGPGWLPPVAFLVAWSNVLWGALMLRPRPGFPSDAPRRTPRPRWFSDED
ncbi:DUF3376 domain-containing protein [Naasia sp. SYSU D00948]|uniref:DUF3376 domain-containing protein n=1 Tax=Naasia sp. SYSU D00948 TaxID=2817379 RepID=UPI001B3005D2|nr:DUF3376 domain-containing protein [Naasia sp. SYSU D00948]